MAIIPKQSIFDSGELKPSTFRLWCVMCEVKSRNFDDIFLSAEKAGEAGIKKTAYYAGLSELELKKWIEFAGQSDHRKFWKLKKGFSAFTETNQPQTDTNKGVSANAEYESAFAENNLISASQIPQTRTVNSAFAESFSANAELHIRNTNSLQESLQETEEEERECARTREKAKIPKTKNAHSPNSISFFENSFVQEFWKIFPEKNLSEKQMRTITNRIRDGTAWQKALSFWDENGYNAERIGRICDRHDEIILENHTGITKNGKQKLSKEEFDAQNAEQLKNYVERKARERNV